MHSIILQALDQLTRVTLHEGYQEAQRDFGLVADQSEVTSTIAAYKELINRNQFTGAERNIDWWRKQGWEKFKNTVDTVSATKSKTQEKRSKSVGKSIVLTETNEWLIVIPLDKDASCYHGKYTDWCTTKPFAHHFERYFYQDGVILVYCLQVTTGSKWAIACHPDLSETELFDSNDKRISIDEFERQTRLLASEITQLAMNKAHVPTIDASKARYHQAVEYVKTNLLTVVSTGNRDQRLEQALWFTKKADEMVQYCAATQYRWPEFERFILQMCRSADDGESATGRKLTEQYIEYVVQGRWDRFEAVITNQLANNMSVSLTFEVISSLTRYIDKYVRSSWSELEQVCTQVLNSASTEISTFIITLMFNYIARIGGTWPTGVSAILEYIDRTDSLLVNFEPCRIYMVDNKIGRWPELEARMIGFVYAHDSYDELRDITIILVWYCENIINGRWPELEKVIVSIPKIATTYANRVMHGRWPEAEKRMKFEDLVIYLNSFNHKLTAIK